MKLLLPSPSISSSSSIATTTSFDANAVYTSKTATASCLLAIFRRLLCSRTLPTHPSDQITDTTSIPCDMNQQQSLKSFHTLDASPGIVATLMGLQSFPSHNATSSMPQGDNSMSSGRSMNRVEFGDNEPDHKERLHRKSTLSILEMPTVFELENEEFFVLSFERTSHKKEIRSKGIRKPTAEFRDKRREKYRNKENTSEKVELKKKEDEEIVIKMVLMREEQLVGRTSQVPFQENLSKHEDSALKDLRSDTNAVSAMQESERWINNEDLPENGAKFRRKKKIRSRGRLESKEGEECSSEDSSPVSVLDFDQFIVDPELLTSGEDATWRRKLWSRVEECDEYLSGVSSSSNRRHDLNSKGIEETSNRKRCDIEADCNNWMWREICRRVAEATWKLKDFQEEISADFGLQILNELLDELVHQLAPSVQEII